MMNRVLILPLLVLFVAPALGSLGFMLASGFDRVAWVALLQHPQLVGGMILSLATASAATLISVALSFLLTISFHERGRASPTALSAMLAVPHLAFAIGLGFLIMPSGLFARLLAPLFGWTSPPGWITTHDPYGVALVLALACKESVFLLYLLFNVLAREDVWVSFVGQKAAAHALGHGALSVWLRVFIPQLVPHLIWPIVIVFIYAASVVDVALVLGPTQPPTFALAAWTDINSADPVQNARGLAGALLLALASIAMLGVFAGIIRFTRPLIRRWRVAGPSLAGFPHWLGTTEWFGLKALYIAPLVALIILTCAPLWRFPALLPAALNFAAWAEVAQHTEPLLNSLVLAGLSSLIGLALLIAWLEAAPEKYDRALIILSLALLALPALLTGFGQYRLFLRLGLTATPEGLFLAHLMPAVAYMFIVLKGPYRAFDPRMQQAAQGLLVGMSSFLIMVKWPLLKATLLSAAAIGFAVAFAQYVPAQLISAGRFSTLTMEAVTLSSGANRPLTAAFALLLMLPPLLAFLAAGFLGRPRWRPT